MDLDEAAIQKLKSSGLGVIRIFGLDEEQSIALGFVVVVLFSIFMLLTAPKPNIRRPSAKPADKPAAGTSDKKEEEVVVVKPKGGSVSSREGAKDNPRYLLHEIKDHRRHAVSFALFSHDGGFIVTGSSDRTIGVYDANLFDTKTALMHKVKTEMDHVTNASLSRNNKFLIASLERENTIVVFGISLKKDKLGKASRHLKTFPPTHAPFQLINSVSISHDDHFILSGNEAVVHLLSIKGDLLAQIDPKQYKIYKAVFSPTENVIAIATAQQVGFWKVEEDKKTSQFKEVVPFFNLKKDTHSDAVIDIAFGPLGDKVATTSHDGTWKLWNIAIRPHLGEEPKCLASVRLDGVPFFDKIDFSCEGTKIVASSGSSLFVFDLKGQLFSSLHDAYPIPIHKISFGVNGQVAAVAGDVARIFEMP